MNIKPDIFLALKYLMPKRNAVSVITCISILGVSLGVSVLIVVLAVMTGFTDVLQNQLLETTPHFQIQKHDGYIKQPHEIVEKLKKEGYKTSPVVVSPTLIQVNSSFKPKIIIGIDPFVESPINIKKNIIRGEYSLDSGDLLISNYISRELNLGLGEKVILHSPTKLSKMINVNDDGNLDVAKENRIYLPEEYIIKGIFSTTNKFDAKHIVMGIDDADEVIGIPFGGANNIYGWVEDPFEMKETMEYLNAEFPSLKPLSWQTIHKQFLGVLATEKNMMFFLLVFIVLVAAFTITNTLITVVIQKTREIGLLKSLGASSMRVMRVFLFQGIFVGIIGTICGIGLGIIFVQFRNNILDFISKISGQRIIPIDNLPASILVQDVLIVSVITISLCLIGGLIPAWRAAHLDPAKALRYE